ncbi:N-acetyltransferase [Paractinoplanes durhamensis]|uniref:N-acetyltransferase n=2 Tax=Paractinoplanes durhamensis TaxID=113563 RepID=A0ABQ3Z5B1_9ACTN|nr:N-acetyltransferase [Actinoplanes durhamensis]
MVRIGEHGFMRSDGWHLTDDVPGRVVDFLRSRPALHTMQLTVTAQPRARGTLFGWLETEGAVRGFLYRLSSHRVHLTRLSPEQAESLVVHLGAAGQQLTGVTSDHDTATAFAEAWRRHTGVEATPNWWGRLHRLGTLTPPEPEPAGAARLAGPADLDQVIRWCGDFATAVDDSLDPAAWASSRYADKHFTFWETPTGEPVSMAGSTRLIGGMVRVDPVYTPAHLRGRGYAGAVTVAVSAAALAAGAGDVVLFTNPANRTSNDLYRRIGYVPLAELTGYAFSRT